MTQMAEYDGEVHRFVTIVATVQWR